MIKNSSNYMQHDNELFNDDVQLESLAASLSPFDNDLNPDLVTMDPSFEATNHDFRDNQAFTIDLLFFRCLRFSNKIQPSPQLIAEETFLGFINKAAAGYDSYVYCYTIFNKIVDFKSK